ncbi:Caffeic acid 3-O-methyltransferase [Morus notabilis]|uniref:Caffeic acid 3-O-methyltransferase n=1 Tax=Morus notabilis TaxID=981085 RepID=W9SKF4_9ROSA|nr:Caffeic acid 3-O-methyltransferase [Morus notabilis]
MASSLKLANGATKVICHDRKEEEEAFSHAMCLVTSSAMPVCLKTALELGVFDIIAKAGEGAKLSSAEIVAQMPTNNPDTATMLDRILRLLASHSVLSCSVDTDDKGSNVRRLYGLCPVSKHFVTNEDGISLGHFIAMVQDNVFVNTWPQLKVSILEGGIAFNRSHGMHASEYLGMDLSGYFTTGRMSIAYKAIPDNGKVIVVEATLPVRPEINFAVKSVLASDMGMLLSHPGGKERSQQEFLALATGAGFSGIKFVCCVCTYWVMELYK